MKLLSILFPFFKKRKVNIEDILPDGLIVITADGEFKSYNNQAEIMLSNLKDDFQNYNINDIFENALMLIKNAVDTKKQVVLKTKNDTKEDLFFEFTANYYENGFVVLMRENTQMYKTLTNIKVEYEASKKVNRNKNLFLVNLASDLKNPLQSVIGFSQALLDGLCGQISDKMEKYVRVINKNSYEELQMIEKIVELSRIETGILDHNLQHFDYVNVLQDCLKKYEYKFREKNITVNYEIDKEIRRTVYSEDVLLKQVINNILECAIRLTENGSLDVRVSYPEKNKLVDYSIIPPEQDCEENSFLMFEFTDSGEGLTQEELDNIFEPYLEVEKPNRKNVINSISFLSVKNIIKLLKGNMWLESEPTKGTVYSFIIPIEKGIVQD